ncbi:MAG: 2-hydroxyacid dehydrogenase [Candidatus Eiseniibacteriota bacterium]
MTIVVTTRRLPRAVEAELDRRYTVRRLDHEFAPPRADILKACEGAEVLFKTAGDPMPADFVAALPDSIRMVASYGAAVELMDLKALQARGIEVSNTPGAVTEDTADIAFGLIIAACRRFAEADRLVRSGAWKGVTVTGMMGHKVSGRTLGIVGMGRIGCAVAKRAQGFGMTLLYHNRKPSAEADALKARYCATLPDLLREADIVVLCCPMTQETHHLIDAKALGCMKRSAVIVNVARGAVIDEAALIKALENGTIAAAGLDVYEFEPKIEQALLDLPNTMLLPHIGTATEDGRVAMGMRAIDNIEAFLKTGKPQDRVTP